jgi:hypothetical protein
MGENMLFSWFDAREAKVFGKALAQHFIDRVPAAAKLSDKSFEAKTVKVFKWMSIQIIGFKREHKLNTFKKAQLGNTFQWCLLDAGFDKAYVDKLMQWLVLQLD